MTANILLEPELHVLHRPIALDLLEFASAVDKALPLVDRGPGEILPAFEVIPAHLKLSELVRFANIVHGDSGLGIGDS